jgi:hypothetical protein
MPKRDRDAVSQGLSDILGSTETSDLLGSVIRSDRRRAGRVAPASGEDAAKPNGDMTGHSVIAQYDNKTYNRTDNRASGQTDKQVSVQADVQAGPIEIGQADNPLIESPKGEGRKRPERRLENLLEKRASEVKQMVASPTTTVTLRIPGELNDWLDEYVHRAWPERVRKQELVVEGLRLLFARRGRPGEPILETELLPE